MLDAPDIATGLGFSSVSSAEGPLAGAAKKGALELLPGSVARHPAQDVPGVPIQGTLPLVGASPRAVDSRRRAYRSALSSRRALFSPPADYLLRVQGESMKDVGIFRR